MGFEAQSVDGYAFEFPGDVGTGVYHVFKPIHKDYKLIPAFGQVPGFAERTPQGFVPIPMEFWCDAEKASCPHTGNTIASITRQGTSCKLVLRNRWDEEVIVDGGFNLVSVQQLTQPKQ